MGPPHPAYFCDISQPQAYNESKAARLDVAQTWSPGQLLSQKLNIRYLESKHALTANDEQSNMSEGGIYCMRVDGTSFKEPGRTFVVLERFSGLGALSDLAEQSGPAVPTVPVPAPPFVSQGGASLGERRQAA